MFNKNVQAFGRRMAQLVVTPLVALGVTPNAITIAGLFLNAGVAGVLATGHLLVGGILLVLAGAFDMLDGAVARVTKNFTVFGAFLDSSLDRYSEALIIIGLAYTSGLHHQAVEIVLLLFVLSGSFLTSYARARAEGLGIECDVGLLPRPERIIILAIGLMFHALLLIPVLIVLAVLTNITVFQRIHHVWLKTHNIAPSGEPAEDEAMRRAQAIRHAADGPT